MRSTMAEKRARIVVEVMRDADVDDVLEIEGDAFERTGPGGRLDGSRLREELARAWARLWVARAEPRGPAAAFLVAWHVADELHILDVATRPALRRRGFARALLEVVLRYARENEVRHILLEVRRSNVAAIRLYRAHGFWAMGLRPKYYPDNEDAVEMVLRLDEKGRVVGSKDEIAI
jgi:[ribosomal protein S18]-alanine N-acetyltransferase